MTSRLSHPRLAGVLSEHYFHEEWGGCSCGAPGIDWDVEAWAVHVAEVVLEAESSEPAL